MVYNIKNILLICSSNSMRNSKSQPNLQKFLIYLLDLNYVLRSFVGKAKWM